MRAYPFPHASKETLGPWIEQDDTQEYPQSVLSYRSPAEFEALLQDQARAA